MLNDTVEEYEQNKISFLFEVGKLKGERYSGKYEICSNPACDCGIVNLYLIQDQDKDRKELRRYNFGIDVLNEKIDKRELRNDSHFDIKFATYFIRELKKEDWDNLRTLYYKYKELCTKTCPIEKINASFPINEIEESAAMVGFYEILPFSEELILEVENEKFLIDDQYCVASSCHCTDVVISFIPVSEGNKTTNSYTMIILNYKNNSWEVGNLGKNIKITPEKLMNDLFKQKWKSIFVKRHKKLRILYKNHKNKHSSNVQLSNEKKINRNDPCPCGSGKKYKKCCLLKKSVFN